MVTKSKKATAGKEKKIKVLSLKKETVKNLSGAESKRVKGGLVANASAARQSAIRGTLSVGGHSYVDVSAGASTIDFGL